MKLFKAGPAGEFIGVLLALSLCVSCGQDGKGEAGHRFTNALIDETSPYLLQHAHNPVNWKPWGPEAFEVARKSDKLLVISIGYSSCHWCHVMEEESFEDTGVAALMNEHFISIKVDREERPDVDQVYMSAAQLYTGSGGWPLNIIALPDGKPLYAGTYHRKKDWIEVLEEIATLYRDSPDKAREFANRLTRGVQALNLVEPPEEGQAPKRESLHSAVDTWKAYWDMEWGGNQGRQKFMLPDNLDFLMAYGTLAGEEQSLAFVKTTLDIMGRGGIYDHVGGGFFRYSTDPRWRIPHFEKMLYDNAQLLSVYSKAYTLFKEPAYRELVWQTTAFLDREMRHVDGAYFAAMDADSEGEEGSYYLWTREELERVLEDDFRLFAACYDLAQGKDWQEGKYVLNRLAGDTEFLLQKGLSAEVCNSKKNTWRERLLQARKQRVPPRIDDKVIASWNALLITGFVNAYKAFGEEVFLQKAQEILGFLDTHLLVEGKLLHSYKEGSKRTEGFLEDYSLMAEATLELYSATGDSTYLTKARGFMERAEELFTDKASGLYRFKEDDALIAKIIKTDDGVIPSPNAVMAHNHFKLGHIGYDPAAIGKAVAMLKVVSRNVEQNPDSYTRWAGLMLQVVFPFYEVAVVGPGAPRLQSQLQEEYLPNTLILGTSQPSEMPLFKNRYVEGQDYIYVCQDHSCRLPVTTLHAALQQLGY